MPGDNISQKFIRSQFATYLKGLRSKENYDKEILEDLIQNIKGGYCHGFSVVYAAMHFTGMGVWWEEVLKAISKWNGEQESLNTIIKITVESEEKEFTLEELFEKAITSVVFHQEPKVLEIDQFSLLEPSGPSQTPTFQLSGSTNSRYVIKDRFCASGNMSKEKFIELISEQDLHSSDMIIISNVKHTCCLRFEGEGGSKKYYFYDPNFNEGAREFTCPKQLYENVIRKLSSTISIECISFKENSFTNLRETNKLSLDMLDNCGLHLIAKYSSNSLKDLIGMIKTYEQKTSVITALNTVDEQREKLIRALNTVDEDDCTGWSVVAWNAPDIFDELIGLVSSYKQESVITALNKVDKNDCTGWLIVAWYAPSSLGKLIDMVSEENRASLVANLISQHYLKSKANASSSMLAKAQRIREARTVNDIKKALNKPRGCCCITPFKRSGESSQECLKLLSNIDKYTPYKTPATYV